MKKIRILVVDDSPFMRYTITKALSADEGLEVAGEASDGQEGIRLAKELKPDVITMDVNMPILNGIEAVRRIMTEDPRPVIMLSAYTREGARQTIDALAAGAVDFIAKPSTENALDLSAITDELKKKIREAKNFHLSRAATALRLPTRRLAPAAPAPAPAVSLAEEPRVSRLVVIGSSTGGPIALNTLIRRLPRELPAAVLIAQHMPARYTTSLAEQLNELGTLSVQEAGRGSFLRAGTAYVAPGEYHTEVMKSGLLRVHQREENTSYKPSVDVLFRSAARYFGAATIGVVLTGMGTDGAEGIREIHKAGGRTLAQDEASCVVYGMPRAAVATGCVQRVAPIEGLAEAIQEFLEEPVVEKKAS